MSTNTLIQPMPKAPVVTPATAADVIDAMRSIQTESERWRLAESLYVLIPNGVKGFNEIIDAATAAGVAGGLKVNTLRLYRDTAVRWPSDKRVANVSFSAHREAMVLPSIDAAAKMLDDLSKNLGANKVTVASVRKAIAVQSGKPIPGTSAGQSSQTSSKTPAATKRAVDILSDLSLGGPELIAAIASTTSAPELDLLHAGLSKVIAHVERLRAKAARKSGASKTSAATAPVAPKSAGSPVAKKPQGDLRGL